MSDLFNEAVRSIYEPLLTQNFLRAAYEPLTPEEEEINQDHFDKTRQFWWDQNELHLPNNPVLQLHQIDPEWHYHGYCGGDDFSGFESEPPKWPCRTAKLAMGRDPSFSPTFRYIPRKMKTGSIRVIDKEPRKGKYFTLPIHYRRNSEGKREEE